MNLKILRLFFLLGLVILSLTMSGQSQKNSSHRKELTYRERELPIVDFPSKQSGESVSKEREDDKDLARMKARASRYDRQSSQPIEEGYTISSRVWTSHWSRGLPALPVAESDVVLVGGVLHAQAHLSNDKTGIYSEFTVQIEEVFRDNGKVSLSPGVVVSVERFGGAVRFPSGIIQRYETVGQGMPRVGERYVFFLRRQSEMDFNIVTGYQLEGDVVSPLDGSLVEKGKGTYPFDTYQGFDGSRFLQIVRTATQKANNTF
jgi:hypothetical protein